MVNAPELPKDLSDAVRHVMSTYPREGCGLILRARDGRFRVRPMANAYDKYKAVRPDEYPRDSRTAYTFDGKEQLAVSRELEQTGETLACIFHSHCDVGSYFSSEDKAMAAPDGEVLHPGVSYLVIAVDKGRATAANVFWLEGGEWKQAPVALPT